MIGPRACGKTTIGGKLAKNFGREFVDTDSEFVRLKKCSIAEYVDENGWEAFRDAESGVLANIAVEKGLVVGCGGGIVMRQANRKLLDKGVVVYLKARPEVLAQRLRADPAHGQRPSLTGKSIEDEVREVLDERETLYESCSDVVLDSELELEDVLAVAGEELGRFLG